MRSKLLAPGLVVLPLLGMGGARGIAADRGVSEDWLRTVQEEIRRSEYEYSSTAEGGWSAPNRALGLRSRITGDSIEVVPRTEGGLSWTLQMRFAGINRDGALEARGESTTVPEGNRIEIRRPGLTEWYVNDERGLEQGFTIDEPPGDTGASLLRLHVVLGGDLTASPSDDRSAIIFRASGGQDVLHYEHLVVIDAVGTRLPAWLEVLPGRLAIVVQDDGARYPVTVDPVLTPSTWSPEGGQPNANLGSSVATAGDVNGDGYSDVIVGAGGWDGDLVDEGKALLYLGGASGPSLTPSWSAEGNQAGALFGDSVATAGDVNGDGYHDVLVGAPGYETSPVAADEGWVFVYLGQQASPGLGSSAAWSAKGNETAALLGLSISTAGDVNADGYSDIILGAPFSDAGQGQDGGRAIVFLGGPPVPGTDPSGLGPNGTPQNADWEAHLGSNPGALFGFSVATAGDVDGDGDSEVIVGAPSHNNGQADEGRVLLWEGDPSTDLGPDGRSTNADWRAESNQANARFGYSVGPAGDVNGDGYGDLIIGAIGYGNGGRAFIWLGRNGGLAGDDNPGDAAWFAEVNQSGASFGSSVATAGDVNGDGFADVLVGAYLYDNTPNDEGGAFLYLGSASGPDTTAAWSAESGQTGSWFGLRVATAGDVNGDGFSDVIVGAERYANPTSGEGKAFLYLGSTDGLGAAAGWNRDGDVSASDFAIGLASAGDVDGDGYSDLLVGAPAYDNGQVDEGRVYLFKGMSSGPATSPNWTVESNLQGGLIGYALAGAGDVNGDGYGDVLIGGYGASSGGPDGEGMAFVYMGSSTGLGTSAAWTAEGNQLYALLGHAVASAGDVNRDGYADILVATPYFDFEFTDEGRVFAWYGGPSDANDPAKGASGLGPNGTYLNFDWSERGHQAGALFGRKVATAGDVNGDGYADILIASLYDNGSDDEGRVHLCLGSASGLGAGEAWTAEADQVGAQLGYAIAAAGDVNGDRYSDIVVGANNYDAGQADEGAAFVWYGGPPDPNDPSKGASGLGPNGTTSNADWKAEGDQAGSSQGAAVASAGDVNGDGYSDVIVGQPGYDAGGLTDRGRASVYLGAASGLSATAGWTSDGDQSGSKFGLAVTSPGDSNGDGFSDIAVGAPYRDVSAGDDKGRVSLYFGNGRDGIDRIPRQRRADDAAPIAITGVSDSTSGFLIKVLAKSPAGLGTVRLVYEVKPFGSAFTGPGTLGASDTTDDPLGTGGYVTLSQPVTGLTAGTAYTWRVRILTDSPFFPRSPWIGPPGNGRREVDLRTKN